MSIYFIPHQLIWKVASEKLQLTTGKLFSSNCIGYKRGPTEELKFFNNALTCWSVSMIFLGGCRFQNVLLKADRNFHSGIRPLFDILKFSLIARLRRHKQKNEQTNLVPRVYSAFKMAVSGPPSWKQSRPWERGCEQTWSLSFLCLCPLSLAAKLNKWSIVITGWCHQQPIIGHFSALFVISPLRSILSS